MKKIIVYVGILVMISGCSFSPKAEKVVYVKEQPSSKQSTYPSDTTSKKPLHVKSASPVNGMIRGVIEVQRHNADKNVWVYEVEAVDATNDKLKKATFVSPKKIHEPGDLVYAIIRYGRLQEIYLIKRNYKVFKNTYEKPTNPYTVVATPKKNKRTKSRQTPWISVPQEEKISLE